MEEFKDRLKKLMKGKKFNSSSLSRQLGKASTTVLNWVDGKAMPELNIIEKIAAELGTTPAYLLYGIKEPDPPNQLQEPAAVYGTIKLDKEELIEFYKWKADKAVKESEQATKQIERLQNSQVDAN
jgi:transcriptional regulator with XRE-family HTH domain